MYSAVLIAVIVIAIIVQLVFAPKFSVAQRPGISRKSRTYKMICATMFVVIGFACAMLVNNRSEYAKFMLIGLLLSWVGDLFLHIKGMKAFITGFFSFTAAHVFYLIAYYNAAKAYFPRRKFFTAAEIIIFAFVELLMFLYYTVIKKMPVKNKNMLACCFYGFVLIPMVIKATAFSVEYVTAGYKYAVVASMMLTFGAICFFMSDTSLALLMFNKPDRNNYKLKNHNIGTYFTAQTLLALTILFIK